MQSRYKYAFIIVMGVILRLSREYSVEHLEKLFSAFSQILLKRVETKILNLKVIVD